MNGGTDCLTVLMALTSVSFLILYHVSYFMSMMIFLSNFLQPLGIVFEWRLL